MKFTSKSKEKGLLLHHHLMKIKKNSSISAPNLLYISLCLPIIFIFYLLYSTKSQHYNLKTTIHHSHINYTEEECDVFNGDWIPEKNIDKDFLYTNYSCKTIPSMRNCLLHGRKDTDYLHWRWKPKKCEIKRFEPKLFLTILRGKNMAFIGDSLARNQMESLLCLLSQEEIPTQEYKDKEDRFVTWKFPRHNFTLMVFWSQFLVMASSEIVINGTWTGGFNLHLDKVDETWSEKLPILDYLIFSDAHWFFRKNYLYENGNLIGCVYCQKPNVTDVGPGYSIRRAFRAAFEKINNCKNCTRKYTLLRTYSPAHFENGAWNEGGSCNRTRPFSEKEANVDGSDKDYRNIQLEEIERARTLGGQNGNLFEILDITRAMGMRPDGHPDVHSGNKWMKGYSDCIHWCLPGPIDTWNEILLWIIRKKLSN